MKACALLALAVLATSAQAAMIATAQTGDPKASMKLYDEQGPCAGDARKAEFVKLDEVPVVGCWVVRAGGFISISWLDGDADRVPLTALNHDAI